MYENLRRWANGPECSVAEAARILKVSRETVRRMILRGDLYAWPAVRAHVAVHLADILQARHLPDSAPEDLTYALTMIEEYGREACRIEAPWRRGETENSRWSCWCWHSAEASPDLYARMFRMVTTGNPRPHGVPRERRAEVMHSLCNAKIKLMVAAAIAPVQGTNQPSFR